MSNKNFISKYLKAISGQDKTPELCAEYITDSHMIEHIAAFESGFPRYELFEDELVEEDNKVVLKGRCRGTHSKEWNGMPPTNKTIEFPFVIRYTIENGKISDHWILIDQVSMMEQLNS